MKNKILIAAALLLSTYFLQSCGNSNNKAENEMNSSMNHMGQNDQMNSGEMGGDNDMMKAMSGTMGKMESMKITGDFDLDFANMMIIHHQRAIDMSEVEIAKGSAEQMKDMAKNIISAQKSEIAQFQAFIKNYKIPATKGNTAEMHDELTGTMKAMMETMNNMKMTGNTDKDFAMMMITHHESAVEMAKNQLSHGKQLELKKMAQKVIADQSREIDEFKSWSSE